MWEKGQKTKRTYFWIASEDIIEFSEALRNDEALRDIQWRCSHPSPEHHLSHSYDRLIAAIECDKGAKSPYISQAFATLALSSLMFISFGRKRQIDPKDGYSDHVFPSEIDMVECGNIAIRWNTQDACDATLALLAGQLKAIWAALKQATLPAKVQTLNGQPLFGFRIGRQMKKTIEEEKLYLQANGPFCRLV